MRIRIFSREPPHGRCLMLAHTLKQATNLSPAECLALAEGLFAFAHKQENPVLIEISNEKVAEDLAMKCVEFGISVEIAAPHAQGEGKLGRR